MLTNTHTII